MKKVIVKVLFIILIFYIIVENYNFCYAREDITGTVPKSTSQSSSTTSSSQIINPDTYTPKTDTSGDASLTGAASAVLTTIRAIGVVASVIILAIIGLKYMIGSVEEKAEYKKTMIPYIIGALLLFAGTQLVQYIYTAMK